jgi:hypothetical protein
MELRTIARVGVVALTLFAGLPATTVAQSTGTIGGVVKDVSGAVMPGVTVEASSPALIEKARIGVTDGQGQYKIVNLTPGVYAVTFTLTGFSHQGRAERRDHGAGHDATQRGRHRRFGRHLPDRWRQYQGNTDCG